MKLRRRIVWMLRVFLAGVIFVLLFHAIGREDFAQALSQTDWRWLGPLYAIAAFTIALNAALLQYLLRHGGLAVRLRRVLLAKSLGSFYALILPGDFFAGAAKWADLSAATGDKGRVLSSMVLSKIFLAVPPLLVGSIALAIDSPLREPSLTIAAGSTAAIVVSVTTLLLNPVTGGRFNAAITLLLCRAPAFVRKPGQRMLTSLTEFQRLPLHAYIVILGLSFSVFALSILGMYIATAAVGIEVPLAVLYWVSLILFISRMLPLTVGNLGVREGILVAAFGLYGIQPAPSVLVGLLMFSSVLIIGIVGGAYQLAIATGWIDWRPAQGSR